ncbi:MAG TPA: deoxyribodipyrimidine photo-lyase [Polyangiales bacterium]|nr:deoxyribodipyrimidine photo-lyase [Polyangiales bacterium]
MRAVVWFRGKDLRLREHAALARASRGCRELIPVFVLAPEYFEGTAAAGSAPHRVQFLLESLAELAAGLTALGSRLLVLRGPALRALPELVAQARADRVFAIGACEPGARLRDRQLAARLSVPFELCGYETLREPGTLRTGSGGPFQVYTPFARAALAGFERPQLTAAIEHLPPWPAQLALQGEVIPTLAELGLRHNPNLQLGGERAALDRLERFLHDHAARYHELRDRMDLPGTSRLSADLHFGTLSARTIYASAHAALADRQPRAWERFRAELLWREFAHHTLFDRPDVLTKPFRRDFEGFPWRRDERGWSAWATGHTGYPIVDAAARQLLREGFVHNRARMVAASFLTKHLAIHYRRGEAHYLQWLTDGDPASNNLGWQWCAGSGVDAQPYFRVFNPISQGERFDPEGAYVRRYVPELARLPTRYIHAPFDAPPAVLERAGVSLGTTYPEPVVEHAAARQRFLLIASEHVGRKRGSSPRM